MHRSRDHHVRSGFRAAILCLAACSLTFPPEGVRAQETDPKVWSAAAGVSAFDLCRGDAPDAAAVAEHGEALGWGAFAPYLEHLEGFKREAGGEARRTFNVDGAHASSELSVQSGRVVSQTTADVHYFRCSLASDQDVRAELTAYFTHIYGPATVDSPDETVWLKGSASLTGPGEFDALRAVAAAGKGASITRIELSNERGLTRAKLSQFDNAGPPPAPD